MTTETTDAKPADEAESGRLPFGGTVRDLRVSVGKLARRGERVFERTLLAPERPMTRANQELNLMAHGASFHGYALASVLAMVADKDPALAFEAACMVQDIGYNGGAEWCDDIWGDIKDAGAEAEKPATEQAEVSV